MIGSAIAIRYVGKKPWLLAFMFWAVYFIMGILFVTLVVTSNWWLGVVLSFAIFMGLATFWLKMAPILGVVAFVVAYVVDIIIMYFLALIGISLTSIIGGLGL